MQTLGESGCFLSLLEPNIILVRVGQFSVNGDVSFVLVLFAGICEHSNFAALRLKSKEESAEQNSFHYLPHKKVK